ncbi:hypothetical protein CsSME_00053330 [Camellia sinensis var. sinensis]
MSSSPYHLLNRLIYVPVCGIAITKTWKEINEIVVKGTEWEDKEEGKEIMQQWEDDWDDDDVNDDFSVQLRKELESNAEKN